MLYLCLAYLFIFESIKWGASKIQFFFLSMSHFDWPITPKKSERRLPKVKVSIGRQRSPLPQPTYTAEKKTTFGQNIWDICVLVLGTSCETHWEFEERFGNLMRTHWEHKKQKNNPHAPLPRPLPREKKTLSLFGPCSIASLLGRFSIPTCVCHNFHPNFQPRLL